MYTDPVCAFVNCGQGSCIASSTGFDCECYPGWKKIQIGVLTFPSCVVPNCEFVFLAQVSRPFIFFLFLEGAIPSSQTFLGTF